MNLTDLQLIKSPSAYRRVSYVISVAMMIAFVAAINRSNHTNDLQRVLKRGVLTILTTESATTFFKKSGVCNGFEFLIANDFARNLGVELEVKTKNNFEELKLALNAGEGNLIAANLTQTMLSQHLLDFSMPYHYVSEQLIYRREKPKPDTIIDLQGTMVLTNQPSFFVAQIKDTQQDNPELILINNPSLSNVDIIRVVHSNDNDFSITDSLSFNINRHIFHEVALGIEISEKKPLSWGFLKNGDKSLLSIADLFNNDFTAKKNRRN